MLDYSKWREEEPLNSFNYNFKSKKKRISLTFDPFSFAVLLLILSSILSCIIYFLLNFNLESEIQFFHQILSLHNQTISKIETRIIQQILSKENLQRINQIIINTNRISNDFNITQIQNNLQDIANVIRHNAPPN
jgi:hypothetical protein